MKITRSKVLNTFRDVAAVQEQIVPSELRNDVQPSLDLNPQFTDVLKTVEISGTTTGTAYTTPTDKDFYLTYYHLSMTKDAVSDNTGVLMNATIQGKSSRIAQISTQTTTAGSFQTTMAFAYPLKIDRGTLITCSGSTTGGTLIKNLIVAGFIME